MKNENKRWIDGKMVRWLNNRWLGGKVVRWLGGRFFYLSIHLTIFLLLSIYLYAREKRQPKPVDLIDIPTADIFEYGGYDLNFRLDTSGGVLTRLTFGVLKPINIGIGFDIDGLIGGGSVNFRPPAIIFKARPFSGSMKLPAVSLGFDGQGYWYYDKAEDKHRHREKGLYVVLSKELFTSGFETNLGGNINDFRRGDAFAFLGFSYNVEDRIIFMTEYDNIRDLRWNRWNFGTKIFITGDVSVDIAVRNLLRGPDSERIIRIDYRGVF